jgi:hypothetical protein
MIVAGISGAVKLPCYNSNYSGERYRLFPISGKPTAAF